MQPPVPWHYCKACVQHKAYSTYFQVNCPVEWNRVNSTSSWKLLIQVYSGTLDPILFCWHFKLPHISSCIPCNQLAFCTLTAVHVFSIWSKAVFMRQLRVVKKILGYFLTWKWGYTDRAVSSLRYGLGCWICSANVRAVLPGLLSLTLPWSVAFQSLIAQLFSTEEPQFEVTQCVIPLFTLWGRAPGTNNCSFLQELILVWIGCLQLCQLWLHKQMCCHITKIMTTS